jgi:toxin ParE1/3/4
VSQAWRLTPRALEDLDAIADYTIEKWGVNQLDGYLGLLVESFERLSENPSLGRERPDIQPGYRCFPAGSHIVFYIEDGNFINIIGISHKSMDVGSLFL